MKIALLGRTWKSGVNDATTLQNILTTGFVRSDAVIMVDAIAIDTEGMKIMAGRPPFAYDDVIDKINDLRFDCNFTLKQIAKKFGVHERTVYKWRSQERQPNMVHKKRIMRTWYYYRKGY